MTAPAPKGPTRRALAAGAIALTLAAGCVGDFDPEKFFPEPGQDASVADGGAEGAVEPGGTDASEDAGSSSNPDAGQGSQDAGRDSQDAPRDAGPAEPDGSQQEPVESSDEDAGAEAMDDLDPLSQQDWTASASAQAELAYLAVDGDSTTRWSTGAVMTGGEWFQVDLGRSVRFGGIVIDAADSADDFPVGYRVYASDDPGAFGTAIAEGAGTGALTNVDFDTQTARHLRIEQTGSSDVSWWSIHELTLQGP